MSPRIVWVKLLIRLVVVLWVCFSIEIRRRSKYQVKTVLVLLKVPVEMYYFWSFLKNLKGVCFGKEWISSISLGIINIFTMSSYLQLLIAGLGSVLFSGFIIYDTKLITDRSYKVYKKEDFIIASINIYLDIINLFLYILQCLSLSNDSN